MLTFGLRRGLALVIPLSILAFAAIGCGKADSGDSGAASSVSAAPASMAKQRVMKDEATATGGVKLSASLAPSAPQVRNASLSINEPPAVQTRQVIRKAELDIRVQNVEKAEKAASAAIQAAGGYTDSASSSDLASTHPELTMTARIPVGSFESVISKFESLGVRLSKTIGSEDVTGRIVDMDAQLKTLRVQAEVYRNMLRSRTQMSEVFEVQQQLTQVQTQIEQIESERKSTANLATMSTVSLKLEQNGVISQPSTDPGWMAQSWAESTSGASGALRCATVAGMWILCFAPFWIPIALLVRKLIKMSLPQRGPDAVSP